MKTNEGYLQNVEQENINTNVISCDDQAEFGNDNILNIIQRILKILLIFSSLNDSRNDMVHNDILAAFVDIDSILEKYVLQNKHIGSSKSTTSYGYSNFTSEIHSLMFGISNNIFLDKPHTLSSLSVSELFDYVLLKMHNLILKSNEELKSELIHSALDGLCTISKYKYEAIDSDKFDCDSNNYENISKSQLKAIFSGLNALYDPDNEFILQMNYGTENLLCNIDLIFIEDSILYEVIPSSFIRKIKASQFISLQISTEDYDKYANGISPLILNWFLNIDLNLTFDEIENIIQTGINFNPLKFYSPLLKLLISHKNSITNDHVDVLLQNLSGNNPDTVNSRIKCIYMICNIMSIHQDIIPEQLEKITEMLDGIGQQNPPDCVLNLLFYAKDIVDRMNTHYIAQ